MASGDDKPEGVAGMSRRKAVKPPTIDLEASEVKQPDRENRDEVEPPVGDGPGEEHRQQETSETATPDNGNAAHRDGRVSRLPAMLATGLAGGLVALAFFIALQFAGVLPAFDDGADEAVAAQAIANAEAMEALEARLAALEAVDSGAAPDEGVFERLEQLERRLAEMPAAEVPDLSAIEQRMSQIQEQVTELDARISEVGQTAPLEADPEIEQRLSGLEQALSEQQGALQSFREEIGRQMSSIEAALRETGGTVDRGLARAAAGAVALSSLMRAMDTGRPYERELRNLTSLVDEGVNLSALPAHAESGLPTATRLAAEFASRSSAILSAGDEPAEDDGIAARLAAGARSLVRIRPAGPVPGTSRDAVISRIEDALGQGDLQVAYAEWQNLDSTAQAAASEWGETLRSRVEAEAEVAEIASATAAAVGDPAPASN